MRTPPLFPAQRLWRAAAVAVFAASVLLFWVAQTIGVRNPFPTLCALKEMTGLPCPLCGGTRAMIALSHGDIGLALHLNAIAIPVVGIGLLSLAILGWEAVRGRAVTDWQAFFSKFGPWLPMTVIILLFVWWIPQLTGALQGSKPELIDLRNPIARFLSEHIPAGRP